MKEATNESKNAVIKTLAIIGFIAAILIGLWLAVQIVRFIPTAFSTLASITDGVYDREERLVVSTEKNIVNSGEAFRVAWTNIKSDGTLTFSYRCVDGVSGEARNSDGDIASLACDTKLPVARGNNDIDVIFSSEKRRFTDIPYSVSFVRDGEDEAALETSGLITIVNASISQSEQRTIAETDNEPAEELTNTGTSGNKSGSTGTSVPVSNPNGVTDFAVTYLGVGSMDANDVFTPRANIDNDMRGAIRFEVKNVGTKTSDFWTFAATLPTNSAFTYNSALQQALRPNERTVITLGFSNVGNAGTYPVRVTVAGLGDQNISNNTFTWSVQVVD